MSSVYARKLFEKYESEFQEVIGRVVTDKQRAIPYIVMKITTSLVPRMAADLSQVKSLRGYEKKQLVIDAVEVAITEVFRKLNEIPELAGAKWDDDLKMLLLTLIGPTLDNLVAVERGQLVINKRVRSKLCSCFKAQ